MNMAISDKQEQSGKSINESLKNLENRFKSLEQNNEQKLENMRTTMSRQLTSIQEENQKKLDSIQQIALIAGDEDLFDHAEECFAAGGVIYKIRRQILTAIGQTILGEITGNDEQLNPITATIADRIKESAVVVQVESISFVNDTVPLNSINRPISID